MFSWRFILLKELIEEAPQEFFRSGPDTFYALGRICCDATTDEARLNAHSILLQGNQVSMSWDLIMITSSHMMTLKTN